MGPASLLRLNAVIYFLQPCVTLQAGIQKESLLDWCDVTRASVLPGKKTPIIKDQLHLLSGIIYTIHQLFTPRPNLIEFD